MVGTGSNLLTMADNLGTDKNTIFLDLSEDNGVIATHLEQVEFSKRVAPQLENDDKQHNTLKDFLIVIGCVNVPDGHFAFDSSFLAPQAKAGFIKLSRLFDSLTEKTVFDPTPPLSIFGHADPVGGYEYNSILSARRAKSVYAVLIRDINTWDHLFKSPHPMGGDIWGSDAIQAMIETVGLPDGTPPNAQTQTPHDAARSIRSNDKLRLALYQKYMDFLCVRLVNGQESEFKLEKDKHFLARGANANGKGDLQGCGEFNPTLILSKKKDDEFRKTADKDERNQENAKNRRVLIFLFKPGSRIDPQKWPCPHVNQGAAAVGVCKARFWPDSDDRLKQDPEDDKEFRKELPKLRKDTFGGTYACRFYQGFAQDSPCEGIHKQWVVRILQDVPREDQDPVQDPKPVANKKFLATLSNRPESPRIRGETDSKGILRLPVFDDVATMELKLDVGELLVPKGVKQVPADTGSSSGTEGEKEEDRFMTFTLKGGELKKLDTSDKDEQKLAVKQRLYNLGYGRNKLEEWDEEIFTQALKMFQRHHKLKDDGTINDDTLKKLREVYEPAPTPPKDDE